MNSNSDYDLVLHGGTVVLPDGPFVGDIGIRDGRIAALNQRDDPLARENVLDVTGLLVLPGVVDTHVHFGLEQGRGAAALATADDYESGPRQAAHGGVTMFVDYVIPPGCAPLDEVHARMVQARRSSVIDFSFHAGIVDPSARSLGDMRVLAHEGITSFKFFTTYKGWVGVDLGFLTQAFSVCREIQALAAVHCEQDEIVEYWRERYHQDGYTDLRYHSRSRPDYAEAIAVAEVALLADAMDVPLHVVHLSSAKGLEVLGNLKKGGVAVSAETCPHYMEFSDEIYEEDTGYLYTMTPPLRPKGNQAALWEGVADGRISLLASDHNGFTREQKLAEARKDFYHVAPGIPGTETLLPYIYTRGYETGRLSLSDLARLLASEPARRFGIPRKGVIQVGFDADLVVIDPACRHRPTPDFITSSAGYSVFEHIELGGWPVYTISRGRIIYDHDRYVGQPGTGQFVPRQPIPRVEPSATVRGWIR